VIQWLRQRHRVLVVRRGGRVLVVNPGPAGEGCDPRNGGQSNRVVLDS
jgi:hypothetical protein